MKGVGGERSDTIHMVMTLDVYLCILFTKTVPNIMCTYIRCSVAVSAVAQNVLMFSLGLYLCTTANL